MSDDNLLGSLASQTITNAIGGMFGNYQQNDFALKEILEILKRFTCGKSLRDTLPNLIRGVTQVLLIIILKRYITNPDKMLSAFKRAGWCVLASVLYKRESFTTTTTASYEGNMTRAISTKFDPQFVDDLGVEYVRCLPVYIHYTNNAGTVHLQYARYVHEPIIEKMKVEARATVPPSATTTYYKWSSKHSRYDRMHPSRLYPSKNYRMMEEIVRKNIKVSKKTKSYPVVTISIDGCPGLGKSKLSEHLASCVCSDPDNAISKVYRIDMSEMGCMKVAPEKIIEDAILSITVGEDTPTVIFVDEIDKHLAEGCSFTYADFLRTKKPDVEAPSFESWRLDVKKKTLLSIQAVIEKTGNMSCCVVVFCTNNFDTLFEGIDMTHFDSLKDRFNPITFERCDRTEIEGYLRYHNDLMRQFEDVYEPNLESILLSLPDDISITYRSLDHLMRRCCHSPERVVRELTKCELLVSRSSIPECSSSDNISTFIPPIPPQVVKSVVKSNDPTTCDGCRHHIDECLCVCDTCQKRVCECPCYGCMRQTDRCTCEKCPVCRMIDCTCDECWACNARKANCECYGFCGKCDKIMGPEVVEEKKCMCKRCVDCDETVCTQKTCNVCNVKFKACESRGIDKYRTYDPVKDYTKYPDVCNECFKITQPRCVQPKEGKIPKYICKDCKHFTLLRCECEPCQATVIKPRGCCNFLVTCHVCVTKDTETYISDVEVDPEEKRIACTIVKSCLTSEKDSDGSWTSYLQMFKTLNEPNIVRVFRDQGESYTKFRKGLARRIKHDMRYPGPDTTSEVIAKNLSVFNDALINYYIPLIEDVVVEDTPAVEDENL